MQENHNIADEVGHGRVFAPQFPVLLVKAVERVCATVPRIVSEGGGACFCATAPRMFIRSTHIISENYDK